MSTQIIAPADETLQHELDLLEEGLVEEFCPPLDPDEVRRCCVDAVASFDWAEIRSYIVVLVEHDLRQKLRRVRSATELAAVNRRGGAADATRSSGVGPTDV